MTTWHPFAECIRLHVENRISLQDAQRQELTAREVLRRLQSNPGLVLADEVGMGKTFVALAAATSVSLSDPLRRPVVVMVPSSLKEKWPQDFAVFREKCLDSAARTRVRAASAESAVEFLRLLDDAPERRNSIVFLTHGAMHRGLSDSWVKLAMIQRALKGRHHIESLRGALTRCLGKLLQLSWVESRQADIWDRLLDAPPANWLKLLHRYGITLNSDHDPSKDDDPVPEAVINALHTLDTAAIYQQLQSVPVRYSENWDERVKAVRQQLSDQLKGVWHECLARLNFRLPLLIMDEAHHLKNAPRSSPGYSRCRTRGRTLRRSGAGRWAECSSGCSF